MQSQFFKTVYLRFLRSRSTFRQQQRQLQKCVFFRKARKLWPSRGEGARERERPVFGGTVRRSHRPTNLSRRLRQRSPRLLLWELWDLRSGTSTPQRMRHLLVYAFRYVERYLELVSHSMCMGMCICVCILVVCLCVCVRLYGKQSQPTIVKTKRRVYLWLWVYTEFILHPHPAESPSEFSVCVCL